MRNTYFDIPIWLWIVVLVFFNYHVWILPISPLPWFDETYFASMGLNFLETGTFEAKISPMSDFYYPQTKAYGPGYFLVLSGMYKLFGFGIFQTRIPGLFFGFGIALTGYKILKESGIKETLCSIFVILLLLDPIFLQNIHSGRMDSMALMFTFLGVFFLIKSLQKHQWLSFGLVGLFFGLALLTTPRVAICLIGPSLILAISFFYTPSKSLFLKCFLVLGLILILYFIWILWGFGGPVEFYQYIFGAPKVNIGSNSVADSYISGNGYIPVFQKPAVGLAIFAAIYLVLIKRNFSNPLLWISIISLISYYSLVKDTGIYSIFSMPYVYFILIIATNSLLNLKIFGFDPKWLLITLLLLNSSIFLLKNVIIILFSSDRNSDSVQIQISNKIPKGSRVIGEEIYYYMVQKAKSDFQYLDRGADSQNRKEYHEKQYNYQYVISRNPPANIQEFRYYNSKNKLIPIHIITKQKNSKILLNIRAFLARYGLYFPTSYEGIIYLRK